MTPAVLALAIVAALAASASGAPGQNATSVQEVIVVGVTPVPGANLDLAKAPYAVRTLSAADLAIDRVPSATAAMASRLGGVNINDNLDDPFQPDLLYRGFEASPVLGTPQGLAVYQDGVRINEAFGDTVNWDLVPSDAIAEIALVGTNPVYGRNALGGAVVITMKDGFAFPGGEAEASGGAFGRRSLGLTWGAHSDHLAAFVAARGVDEAGWRERSADHLRQFYGAVASRTERLDLALSFVADDNLLHGESAAPVQELAIDRRLIFTSPQANADRLAFLTLNGTWRASARLSLQGVAYLRDFHQSAINGNTSTFRQCAAPAGAFLCQSDAATALLTTAGAPIPDLSEGGARLVGENDSQETRAETFGGSLQTTSTAKLFGRSNQVSLGLVGDGGVIDFGSDVEPGVIDASLFVQPSGYLVATPEGEAFPATPVRLRADTADFAVFVTDALDLSRRLTLTASGRFDRLWIALHDREGSRLSGASAYSRFDPALGATFRLGEGVSAYAGYAEGSRAPTASEIECSDPQSPCLLPSSLSADPHGLRQVVSRTVEVGLRGSRPMRGGRITFDLSLYRTEVRDDIYAVATSLSSGYFRNIRGDRRDGGEIDLGWRGGPWAVDLSYAHVEAVFDANFTIPSPANPFRDGNGDIQVRRGDHLPGIPRDRLKLNAEYRFHGGLRVGGELQLVGAQYYRGDESNQLGPLPGYAVVGLHADCPVGRRIDVFARAENALNARYATFGLLGDPTGAGAPGVPSDRSLADPRFQSPAPPTALYAGVRMRF